MSEAPEILGHSPYSLIKVPSESGVLEDSYPGGLYPFLLKTVNDD
jgi:hypothetical protein